MPLSICSVLPDTHSGVNNTACTIDGGRAGATLHGDVLEAGGVEVPGAVALVHRHAIAQREVLLM